ncbi:helix-turn-helix domain-containing protein [Bacillus weihaiensis]|uniref:Transcriptional regulator n=1 Tax=Bacillus weihaiensis TaxID=1547283 RepID=A0A1L3MPZ1_9BACI|nr:helix-turn-helix domain-containing protein [Bacillus weihaiensis]APH04409.1 transcriptional regulator [Bacillus weihaiensis]
MLGKRLRELRQEKGYSISELAELSGVSKSYLSYIERDVQKNPSLQFLTKISNTLEVDVHELVGTRSPLIHPHEILKDQEWHQLINYAIKEGMSKNDFKEFIDFLRFKKSRNENNFS